MAYRPLRWGLLSTARINRALIPPLRASERNKLVAVASRNPAQAKSYALEWEIPTAYGSYEELIADPDVDVIYNPLPNSMHAEWTIRAVRSGKHVLCEKPLALTVAEVDEIQAAAHQAGVVVTEAFMYRHHPQTQKVKEMIDSGEIGELQVIKGSFTFLIDNPNNIRLDPGMGGGSIWDVGCYPISFARTMVGAEPEEVFGWQISTDRGVDETFAGQMRFPGGVVAQIHSGFRSPFHASMEIFGSRGSLFIPCPFKPQFGESIQFKRYSTVQEICMPGADLYQGEVEDLASAVLEGSPPHISLADSRANVKAIVALLASSQRGEPVVL